MRVAGAIVLAGALILLPISAGHAASLTPLTTASLSVQHGEPVVVALLHDGFASPSKADLDGRVLAEGQIWAAPTKTFEVQAGDCYTTKNNLPLSLATLPWMSIPTTVVSADLTSSGAQDFGLLLQADRSSQSAVALRLMTGNIVQLARLDAGVWTTLGSTTAGPNAAWSLRYDHGTYSVSRNAVTLISYAATPAEDAAWRTHGDVGIYASGNKTALWANFTVESP